MKTNPPLTRLLARACGVLLLGTALATQAQGLVTFQVDMSVKNAESVFNPALDQVTARGSFNNWGNGFVLTPSTSNPLIYQGTFDVIAGTGSTVEYKFVFNNGGDQWETRGNRSFVHTGQAQTLPVVFFDDDSVASVTVTTPVTFRVDMGVKIAEGVFNPASHLLTARGSFNGWTAGFQLNPSTADPNIYEGTTDITDLTGATILFKYVIFDTADQWEGDPNRSFTLEATAQTLPLDYFNRDSVISIPIKAAVAFEMDMNVQLAAGNFDRATDEVWVRGNRMGWGAPDAGFHLFEDASRPGIFTNIYLMESELTGSVMEYKHTIWRTGTTETVWEDGANKTLTFDGSEPLNAQGYHQINVAKTFFNNIGPSDVLTADTMVSFRVDMRAALNGDGSAFDPSIQGVWVNGNFAPWWTWNTQPPEYQLMDHGATGDAVAGDKIYTLQRLFPRGASTRLEYKYGIDSADNEAGFGRNHVRYIRASGTYIMPVDVFGTMDIEPEVGSLAISAQTGGNVTLTWNGRPGVRLQSASTVAGGAWTDVPGTDGLSSKVIPAGTGNQFFRLAK